MRLLLCLVTILSGVVRAADAPTTSPDGTETLASGAVIFNVPDGYKSLGKRADDLSEGYAPPDGNGQIVVTVTPQAQDITDELAKPLATKVIQVIKAEVAKGNIQSMSPPKVEDDKRFFLKIHDQFMVEDKFIDRVMLYRDVGKNLVLVVSTAFSSEKPKIQPIDDAGEYLTLSMRLNKPGAKSLLPRTPPAPTTQTFVYSEAHLRVTPPAGWTAQPTHQASGTIVIWHDPSDTANLITLSYRPLPALADDDSHLRDLAIQQIAAGEKPAFQMAGAQQIGQVQSMADKHFINKTRTDYQFKEIKLRVTFRQLRVGDGVVSVTNIALQDKADPIDALADKVAVDVHTTQVIMR